MHDLRDLSPISSADGAITLGVAGNASANIDVSEKLADALPLYLVVVVGLSLIILILVFRSILVPITATAGFVLSLLATFGGLTAIYQFGWFGADLRRARSCADPELPAGHRGGHPVRTGDGLPAVPGLRDAGGVRARRAREGGRPARAACRAARSSPPPRSS